MAAGSTPRRNRDSLLKSESGFVFTEFVLMAPVLFVLAAALLAGTGLFFKNFRESADAWIVRSETQRIMEEICEEIEYADMVECLAPGRLRITTRRRAMFNPNVDENYIVFKNSDIKIYRQELNRNPLNYYTVKSTQPMNGDNFFSSNRGSVNFTCTRLAEGLYTVEIKGVCRVSGRSFHLRTAVLKRSPFFDPLGMTPPPSESGA